MAIRSAVPGAPSLRQCKLGVMVGIVATKVACPARTGQTFPLLPQTRCYTAPLSRRLSEVVQCCALPSLGVWQHELDNRTLGSVRDGPNQLPS